MVKIESKGNEQIANALVEDATEKIRQSLSNKQPVFMACKQNSFVSGNTIDILAAIGVSLVEFFTEVRERLGTPAEKALFNSFIEALIDAEQNTNGD